MALRIRTHWHDDDAERSIDEIAGAIAFNAWRIAKNMAINLHGEDFVYNNDEQRFDVIIEYLLFQLALSDRIANERLGLDDETRRKLVIATAKGMAAHLQDNMVDIFGEGDYVQPFVAKLNERAGEYAGFSLNDDGPSYPFRRHLGYEIQQIMGSEHDNRWVIDQVMDKDCYEVYQQISRVIDGLF